MLKLNRANDWRYLQRGDSIELRFIDSGEFLGTIEDYSEDRSTVWVRLHGVNERKLILADDGVLILVP